MKLLVALFAFIAISASAFAANPLYYGNNGVGGSDEAYFTTTVIKTLGIVGQQADLDLPGVVPGYPRDLDPELNKIVFNVDGDATKTLVVTTYAPVATEGTGVTLVGAWTTNTTFSGTPAVAKQEWKCSKVSAATGTLKGTNHNFSITVDVRYSSL